MARPLTIDVPTGVRGVARKQRKVKWHPCRVAVAVEIAETDRLADPEGIVSAYERWAKYGPRKKETVRMTSAGHAGALWRPVKGPTGAQATFAELRAPDAWWRQAPFKAAAGLPTQAELLAGMREIHKDVPDWIAARAAHTAADLLLVGEALYRKDVEPVWKVIQRDDGAVEIDFDRPFYGRIESGIPFPVLQREAAEKAAAELAKAAGVKVKNSGMRLEKADPAFLSATTETALARMMSMAFYAARSVIRRECRGHLPEALQTRFADFARAMAPGGSVVESARLLDSVELTATDFVGHATGNYDPAPRGAMGGGWLRAVQSAVDLGIMKDDAPAPVADDFAPEDEDAIASLGV